MINKLSYLFIITGIFGFLMLLPGVMDGSNYYYYRIKNGTKIELENNCFLVPDGWVKATRDIDNGGYGLLKFDQDQYEIILISKANEVFLTQVHKSALLEKVSKNLYRISKILGSSPNDETRYWLIIPQYDLVIEGRTIPITESFASNLQSTTC
ncbi:hypothetical protein SAMN05216326_1162 [Nitrosomonas marina]|uniref:Uncharacterized protein n=1 Tax=Nitrosomonas marina TaxID=917 RepID=A0A1I0CT20_9PROT|nr:hypothetical protein [Nitrosomonas marina]SET22227.1 hypothetical protein SAMN05216326_1162 [Nitrosomonas marina]